MPGPRHPLFNHAAAEVSIHSPTLDIVNSLTQATSVKAGLSGKARENFGGKYPHLTPHATYDDYNT